MFEFITQHQFWTAVVLYWIFSAAVSSMPEPAPNSKPGYPWLYRFLHSIAGNITTALSTKIPGLKTILLVLMLPVLLSTNACAAHYTVHPGALNRTDSAAYDTLLIAQGAIDQARAEYQTEQLPAGAAGALNMLISSYNVARQSWLTYRGALTEKIPPQAYSDQLKKDLLNLTEAIRKLHERLRMQARAKRERDSAQPQEKGAASNEKEAQ